MKTKRPGTRSSKIKKRHILVAGGILFLAVLTLIKIPWHHGKADSFKDVDIEHLIACVTRANSCYYEPQTIRYEFGSHIDVADFPESGLRVFIDSKTDGTGLQWVVLRGTTNLSNAYADLDFVEREDHELQIKVHQGFDDALQECMPWIIGRIHRGRPICITGHSLGGSVAVLLAATLEKRGYKDVSAVTFGQPKVTDAHGANALNELRVLRVVYEDDPVPLVPPFTVDGIGPSLYQHFGAELLLKSDGHFYYMDAHDPERLDVTDYWSNITHIRPKTHLLGESYIPSLKLALERSKAR